MTAFGAAGQVVFTTQVFPERKRFTAFREMMASLGGLLDFSTSNPDSYWCDMSVKPIGGLEVVRVRSDHAIATSGARARRAEEVIAVHICHAGEQLVDQSQPFRISSGGGWLSASTVEKRINHRSGLVADSLVVRRAQLLPLLRQGWPGDACIDLSQAPAFHLLRGWLMAAPEPHQPVGPELAQLYERTAVDLIALMLGAKGDERELVLGRGVRTAMQAEILRGIKRRAADHGISAERVSCELGITSRYVHKLLEETGKTFSEHVLEERLTLAFAMLTEPSMARRKITDVAAATGFSDISYFNRTFRRRFGDTPSAVRARWRI